MRLSKRPYPCTAILVKDELGSGNFDDANGSRAKRRDTVVRRVSSKIANNFSTRMAEESGSGDAGSKKACR